MVLLIETGYNYNNYRRNFVVEIDTVSDDHITMSSFYIYLYKIT